ncbi:Transducin beta-like protein 2 [Portunus trituberculatus]|uniref:Transducin beta-like protein 2 n=1 Tax=Portunus trituberculatus TaxID=210409 RepID=A0A5B7I552_PORTR|nr:Transducin beta-like protein 2 [Portunus trituberculatus]
MTHPSFPPTDRTVQIWTTKDFSLKEHKSVRGNIEFDYATKVCWSPDGKAVIIHKSVANTIEVYKLTKRPDGSPGSPQMSMTFPQGLSGVPSDLSPCLHLFNFSFNLCTLSAATISSLKPFQMSTILCGKLNFLMFPRH